MTDQLTDYIFIEATEPYYGKRVGMTLVRVHGEEFCRGPVGPNGRPICCIHNQTDHHMKTWTQVWRSETNMMERECEHRIGHPDPDDVTYRRHLGATSYVGEHSCDGCCVPPS